MKSKGIAVIVVILLAATLAIPSTSRAWGGWWVPGAFAGGVLLGAAVARPWYPPAPVYVYPYPYEYPAPRVVYTPPPPPQAYYPPPAPSEAAAAPQGKGQWVDVPGQMVNNIWVPLTRHGYPAVSRTVVLNAARRPGASWFTPSFGTCTSALASFLLI